MATNHSPQFIGDPHISVTPLPEPHSGEDSPLANIHISATLSTVLAETSDDNEDEIPIPSEGRSVTFSTTLHLSPFELDAGKIAVSAAIADVHLEALAGLIAAKILAARSFHCAVEVHAFVHQLPYDSDSEEDEDLDVGEVMFLAARRETIEGLKKEVVEKAVTCTVCLEEVRVGSEATRLPCSHWYHMECIVESLERNNKCPLCRYEMP